MKADKIKMKLYKIFEIQYFSFDNSHTEDMDPDLYVEKKFRTILSNCKYNQYETKTITIHQLKNWANL